MKVKLINPPAIESKFRGAGFYGENLTEALKNLPNIEITNNHSDLVHYLYFDPFFLTLPPIRNQRTIVTVFDLTPLVLPELFPPGIRGKIKWEIQKTLLKTVDHIITISESAKKDIIKFVGFPKEKITVTYLAAGKECVKLPIQKDNTILYIGDINPNKNISSLLKAVAILKNEKLVLVGKALAESKDIKNEIESLGMTERVTLTGFIDEQEKVNLLNKAKVYVQPSVYEGFGLPVLEAMSCGTPVICGNNSSFPEIAGDAATYANVSDPTDLADKIKNIKPTGKELVQASKFSWAKTAEETIRVYRNIL